MLSLLVLCRAEVIIVHAPSTLYACETHVEAVEYVTHLALGSAATLSLRRYVGIRLTSEDFARAILNVGFGIFSTIVPNRNL